MEIDDGLFEITMPKQDLRADAFGLFGILPNLVVGTKVPTSGPACKQSVDLFDRVGKAFGRPLFCFYQFCQYRRGLGSYSLQSDGATRL